MRPSRRQRPGCPGVRVSEWQGDPQVVIISPSHPDRLPTPVTLATCLKELEQSGVRLAVTPALNGYDAKPYQEAGFHHSETLHLLVKSLRQHPPAMEYPTRPGRFWHQNKVLEIDQRAFNSFWRFDSVALDESRRATPFHRYRVTVLDSKVVGYHVTGRAGSKGYLQRLAVDPAYEGRGVGKSLLSDCLGWLYQNQANEVLVNTQETNTRALDLYERAGFVRQEKGLSVLIWEAARQ